MFGQTSSMNANATELVEAALSLPATDRSSYIADKLIESLDEEPLSPEWEQELARRLERYQRPDARTYSSTEAHQAATEAIKAATS